MPSILRYLALAAALAPGPAVAAEGELVRLAADFWAWRAVNQPLSGDDVTRIERPPGWVPDWSAAAVERRRTDLDRFRERWRALDPARLAPPEPDIARHVDHRLLGSALARVEWELEVRPAWRVDPWFYVAQTEGAIFELLLEPPPFSVERSEDLLARLASIPDTIYEARRNLDRLSRPFAEVSLAHLANVRGRLQAAVSQLRPHLSGIEAEALYEATESAVAALEGFARWLEERLPEATAEPAVGREGYEFFLREVALIPWSAEELVERARQEWERALAFEALEWGSHRDLEELPLFGDVGAQIARASEDEAAVRAFLEANALLTVPDWLGHYRNMPMPGYLKPLAALGVTDDLTSPDRLDEDPVSYLPPPGPDLPYFQLATARDPRPILVHEGIPGRYTQLALSWAHENPIRRHYYDSAANEGIAFYAEEMMLQAGFFDDSPRTREIVYNFMRLRALRVEVDVGLATGELTLEEAAELLARKVPMDGATARAEATFFASTPGQAIGYQIGKLQILRFLGETRLAEGDDFDLRRFHDRLWKNGNVPIILQRWEALGPDDEIRALDRLARPSHPVP